MYYMIEHKGIIEHVRGDYLDRLKRRGEKVKVLKEPHGGNRSLWKCNGFRWGRAC